MVECPECADQVQTRPHLLKGEVIRCQSCNVELEVTDVNPVAVVVAPEVEEDWGE